MDHDEMYGIICDICGDGITLNVEEIEITFPSGRKGTDTEYLVWYELNSRSYEQNDSENRNGILYIYGSEIGICSVEEKTYDQIFPKAENKRGPLPKNQFKDRDGQRRYRAYS